MNDDALKERIARLAEPVTTALGLTVWGVEILRAGRTVVRLFVDVPPGAATVPGSSTGVTLAALPGGEDGDVAPEDASPAALSATLDQCEEISRHLGLALEVEDCFSEPYVLEVSTPGLTRQFFSLAQMRPYAGDMVEARLLAPLAAGEAPADAEGIAAPRRVWRGTLQAMDEEAFVLAPATVSPGGDVTPEDAPPVRIPWSAARKVSRMYIFKQPQKPGKGPAAAKKPDGKPGGGKGATRRRPAREN